MSPYSYFWNGAQLLQRDRALLERLDDTTLGIADRRSALLLLLDSDDPVARGTAMDRFNQSIAHLRHGDQPLSDDDEVRRAVRTCALRELRASPFERTDEGASPRCGANHASALNVLHKGAEAEDAPLVARALELNTDEQVIAEGVKAAEPVLRGEDPANPDLVRMLRMISARPDLPHEIRADAIAAVGGAADGAVVAILLEALGSSELAISAAAARALLERDLDRHRAQVAEVSAEWPRTESPPFDAHEVWSLLDESAP